MKRNHSTIQLSTFKAPRFQGRAVSVNYLEGFWLRLFWDILIYGRRFSFEGRLSLFKRVAFAVWALLLLFALKPAPSHIVYADPIVQASQIKPVEAIKMPSLSSQEPVEQVFISKLRDYGTYPNLYAPFNCTSYVASRLPIPDTWGNAASWAYSAAADGYKVSAVPIAGTIATNSTDSYLGHVAIVADVKDGMVRLEEQNYEGPGIISGDRWAPISQYVYIYI